MRLPSKRSYRCCRSKYTSCVKKSTTDHRSHKTHTNMLRLQSISYHYKTLVGFKRSTIATTISGSQRWYHLERNDSVFRLTCCTTKGFAKIRRTWIIRLWSYLNWQLLLIDLLWGLCRRILGSNCLRCVIALPHKISTSSIAHDGSNGKGNTVPHVSIKFSLGMGNKLAVWRGTGNQTLRCEWGQGESHV